MTKELQAFTTTGKTLYAVLVNSVGQVWNGSEFVSIDSDNWGDYDISMTETTAGIYYADMPTDGGGVPT